MTNRCGRSVLLIKTHCVEQCHSNSSRYVRHSVILTIEFVYAEEFFNASGCICLAFKCSDMVAFQHKPFTPELQAHECTICLIYLCFHTCSVSLGRKSNIYVCISLRKCETFAEAVCESAGSTASELTVEAVCESECSVKLLSAKSIYLDLAESCGTIECETYETAEIVKSCFVLSFNLLDCTISCISVSVVVVLYIVLSGRQSDNISLCGTGIKHFEWCCQVTFNTESYRCLVVVFFCYGI